MPNQRVCPKTVSLVTQGTHLADRFESTKCRKSGKKFVFSGGFFLFLTADPSITCFSIKAFLSKFKKKIGESGGNILLLEV
jgi:hypothetical protein